MLDWLKNLFFPKPKFPLNNPQDIAGFEVRGAPVGEDRHTNYMVFQQGKQFITFPESNFLLTTKEHQEGIKKHCKEAYGYPLVIQSANHED